MPVTPVLLSVSGSDRFNACERRWVLTAQQPERRSSPGPALQLGTAIHTLTEARWRGEDFRTNIERAAREVAPSWSARFALPEPIPRAIWLLERHEQMYPVLPMAVATELAFDLPLPGGIGRIRGRVDGLVMDPDPEHRGLWILETKSFGDYKRVDWLPDDPQPFTYMWAVQQQGFTNVAGVLWDGIYTHPKLKNLEGYKEPVDVTFRREFIPFNQTKVDRTMGDYTRQAKRAETVLADPDLAIPTRGSGCTYCGVYGECQELA